MSDIARIEDNIRTMIGKGAPEADIDAYLKSEGHTADSFKKAMNEPSTLDKWKGAANTGANWLGTQFTKGVTSVLGAPQALGDLAVKGGEWAGEKVGAPELGRNIGQAFKTGITFHNILPTTEGLNNTIFGGGESARPQAQAFGVPLPQMGVPEVNAADSPALTLTDPLGFKGTVNVGKMLDTGAQAIPGALMLGGGVLPAVLGGVTSEAAGQATEGSKWEIPARIAGALPGVMLGTKLTTPLPSSLSDEQQRLVQIARDRGVPMTVGQETGRGRGVESALSRFPTSEGPMARFRDTQQRAVNREALSEMNAVGDRVDPETMRRVGQEVGGRFDAARNASGDVPLTPGFYNDARRAVAAYETNTAAGDQIAAVRRQLDNFMDPKLMRANSPYPTLTPEQYQQFRSDLVEAINSQGNPNARRALQNIRESLDDAMGAALPADQAAAWQQARRDYANFKIISKAAAGGTVEGRQSGNLSPSSLGMALRQRQGVDRFARQEGGLNDVARVSGYLADTRPNSGTPQTLAMQGMITGGPLAAGYAAGGPVGAAGAAAMMAAPNIAARAMTGQGWLTPAGPLLPIPASIARNYLANQTLANRPEAIGMGYRTVSPLLLQDARARQ